MATNRCLTRPLAPNGNNRCLTSLYRSLHCYCSRPYKVPVSSSCHTTPALTVTLIFTPTSTAVTAVNIIGSFTNCTCSRGDGEDIKNERREQQVQESGQVSHLAETRTVTHSDTTVLSRLLVQ